MSKPGNNPAADIVQRYVVTTPVPGAGRYLKLLSGNFTRLPIQQRTSFLQALARDARQISDAELKTLLGTGEYRVGWREQTTAAWLIGLDRRSGFRQVLGELLLESEYSPAGRAYCVALTRFRGPEDADLLAAYLDRYLPRLDLEAAQAWALGGLLYLDDVLEASRAARLLTPGGPWSHSAFAETDPASCSVGLPLSTTSPTERWPVCSEAQFVSSTPGAAQHPAKTLPHARPPCRREAGGYGDPGGVVAVNEVG